MDEEAKVNFLKPMLVLKTRDNYKAPYHKNKYLFIKKKNVKNKSSLLKLLKDYVKFWSNGTYELQYLYAESQGFLGNAIYTTFARFDVRDGKVVKIWKSNPFTKKEYLIWQCFKTRTKLTKVKKPHKKAKQHKVKKKKHKK